MWINWLWILVLTVILIGIVWRLASRRQSLPCPVWLGRLVEVDNPFTRCNRAAFIVNTLGPLDGASVLDAGCGPGRLTLPLSQQVGPQGKVVAMDIQAGMLQRTRLRAEALGLTNIAYLHAGLGGGQLPADTFDCVLLVTVLGEIPDQAAALAELASTLKPGGRLVVVEVIFDPHFQRRAVVTRLAAEAGLRPVAFFGHRLAYVMHLVKS